MLYLHYGTGNFILLQILMFALVLSHASLVSSHLLEMFVVKYRRIACKYILRHVTKSYLLTAFYIPGISEPIHNSHCNERKRIKSTDRADQKLAPKEEEEDVMRQIVMEDDKFNCLEQECDFITNEREILIRHLLDHDDSKKKN